jgi:tripartite-type tricarboxylate transporter receptor subunit TctC
MFHRSGMWRAVFAVAILASGLAPMGSAARAQAYPDRPVRLVVPFPPGGSTDVSARLLAQELGRRLGQTIVTENRPGAGTMIGNDVVMRAPADGYTLLYAASSIAITPSINRNISFDPRRDLLPISMFTEAPLILIANPQVPFQDLAGLLAFARANPGRLNVAYPGMGTTNHLAAALFNHSAAVDIVLVPFAGNAAGLTALMRNDVQLAFDSLASASGFIRDGSVRALGVTGTHRSPSLPEVPTVGESAVPGFETTFWFGLMAPLRTPAPVVDRLAQEMAAIVRDAGVVERLRALGFEASTAGGEYFATRVASDFEKWGALIRTARIGVD